MASSSLQQEKGNHGDDTKSIVLKKGKWLPEEDALLREYVRKYGAEKWDKVREKTTLTRDGKSCRFRWLNCLKPSLKKCSFSEEEGRKLIHLHNELGPKWCHMVSQVCLFMLHFYRKTKLKFIRLFMINVIIYYKLLKFIRLSMINVIIYYKLSKIRVFLINKTVVFCMKSTYRPDSS